MSPVAIVPRKSAVRRDELAAQTPHEAASFAFVSPSTIIVRGFANSSFVVASFACDLNDVGCLVPRLSGQGTSLAIETRHRRIDTRLRRWTAGKHRLTAARLRARAARAR
jgi:hypothetical protein